GVVSIWVSPMESAAAQSASLSESRRADFKPYLRRSDVTLRVPAEWRSSMASCLPSESLPVARRSLIFTAVCAGWLSHHAAARKTFDTESGKTRVETANEAGREAADAMTAPVATSCITVTA